VVRDYESPGGVTSSWTVTLIPAGVVLLVILAAVATATVMVDAVRRPVERAVGAARRVAGGDFSARIGSGGPEELVELGQSFDEMASRLEAAERDQRRFLADVAHEIATPLNVISGYAIALADNDIRDPRELHEISAVVHGETERLRSLLANLRELTQLDLAQPGPVEDVDVGELFGQLETRFAPAARQAEIRLQVRGGGIVRSNPRLLTTVLDNLLSNALRYTPAGGEVILSSHRRRQELILSVKDTGVGIDPVDQRRIFDRFYRVDKARDRASGGSGIGLALAQRAARALGGRIELQSTPGRGSEFRLIIPRTSRSPKAATAPLISN
jgi:two-component system sensor histidine kinase BaeS